MDIYIFIYRFILTFLITIAFLTTTMWSTEDINQPHETDLQEMHRLGHHMIKIIPLLWVSSLCILLGGGTTITSWKCFFFGYCTKDGCLEHERVWVWFQLCLQWNGLVWLGLGLGILQRWGDMALLLLPWMGLWAARWSPLIPLGPTLCTLYGKREIKGYFLVCYETIEYCKNILL